MPNRPPTQPRPAGRQQPSVRAEAASRLGFLRPLLLLAFSAVLIVGAIDGGSVVLTRMQLPDAAKQAGYAATVAVQGKTATQQTALLALEAARAEGKSRNLVVSPHGFTMFQDGRITLKATRTAPTILFHRIPQLRSKTEVSVTVTVDALPFS